MQSANIQLGLAQHTVAQLLRKGYSAARPMTVAVTAYCNLRCIGRRYGRDFMPGHQLSLETVRTLLDDARPAAIQTVRLYGGEPLLHPALPQMVRHAVDLGLSSYVTTKGLLLKPKKIRLLYDAGLRNITIACKRPRRDYDRYVQRDDRFRRLEESVYVREQYGSAVSMQLNYFLIRPSCTLEALQNAWGFAQR